MTEEVLQAQQAFSYWKDIIQPVLFPAAGAFAGVLLKEALDLRKSKRQYSVADVEFLCSQINEVRELALTYWAKSSGLEAKIQEAQITGMLHGCAEIIAATNIGTEQDKSSLNDSLRQFRRVCTSGTFGQTKRSEDLGRLAEIEIEGRTFYAKVLTFRRK